MPEDIIEETDVGSAAVTAEASIAFTPPDEDKTDEDAAETGEDEATGIDIVKELRTVKNVLRRRGRENDAEMIALGLVEILSLRTTVKRDAIAIRRLTEQVQEREGIGRELRAYKKKVLEQVSALVDVARGGDPSDRRVV